MHSIEVRACRGAGSTGLPRNEPTVVKGGSSVMLPATTLFGAAYYHEYQPSKRLEEDFRLMAAANFSLIRVGESVWSTWEPSEGSFNLDWLEPVLEQAQMHGISVIIGTPTYAMPPWLRPRYPETTAERKTGQPIP